MSLWADIHDGKASRENFVKLFGQRRNEIVGDSFQLKTDVDAYNAKNPTQRPIQIPLDISYDAEELQLSYKKNAA